MREEVGVDVTDGSVRYVANQPWPFPQSSMIGFRARANCSAGLSPWSDWYNQTQEPGQVPDPPAAVSKVQLSNLNDATTIRVQWSEA